MQKAQLKQVDLETLDDVGGGMGVLGIFGLIAGSLGLLGLGYSMGGSCGQQRYRYGYGPRYDSGGLPPIYPGSNNQRPIAYYGGLGNLPFNNYQRFGSYNGFV